MKCVLNDDDDGAAAPDGGGGGDGGSAAAAATAGDAAGGIMSPAHEPTTPALPQPLPPREPPATRPALG